MGARFFRLIRMVFVSAPGDPISTIYSPFISIALLALALEVAMNRIALDRRFWWVVWPVSLLLIWGNPVSSQPAPAVCDQIFEQYQLIAEGCPARETVRTGARVGVEARMWESHVFFPAGGSRLDAAAQAQIVQLSEVLNISFMRQTCLRLIGHSDSVGGASVNEALSLQRATQVAEVLKARLDDPTRVQEVLGVGEAQPLAGFATTAVENRRVEIWAKTCVR